MLRTRKENLWAQGLRAKLLLGHSVWLQGDQSAIDLWAENWSYFRQTVAAVMLGLVRSHNCHRPVAAFRD